MTKRFFDWVKAKRIRIFGVVVPAAALFGLTIFFLPGVADAHCDTMDGPVVNAAKMALTEKNVNIILPYVSKDSEKELKGAFEKTLVVRAGDKEARELADQYFFETAVRLHRAGEGEPYTGLKPAGLDHGPALPAAEKALASGSVDNLKKLMADTVAEVVEERFAQVMATRAGSNGGSVESARERVEAELRFEVFIHELYLTIKGTGDQHNHGSGQDGHAAADQHSQADSENHGHAEE